MSIDTACSSSLVATHVGSRHLSVAAGAAALCCGVNLMLAPFSTSATQVCGINRQF
jgi:acyl transferase domain-containing protein